MPASNVHNETVSGFGDEWSRFNQANLSKKELSTLFERYFSIFPWDVVPQDAKGFDVGCGSGRWAMLVAPRVGHLHCLDPSVALEVARKNLSEFDNCVFHAASVDAIPLEDRSMDFGYSLGVLHHVPDTQARGALYPRSDSGYVKTILSLGLPLSFLLYAAIIGIFAQLKNVSASYGWLVFFVVMFMLVVEIKEPFLYQNFAARVILLLSGATLLVLGLRSAC